MALVNIITVNTDPKNLDIIRDSILCAKESTSFEIEWYIAYNNSADHKINLTTQIPGTDLKTHLIPQESKNKAELHNRILDQITDGYVYFLNEDTVLHPSLLKEFSDVQIRQQYQGIIFEQVLEDASIRYTKVKYGDPKIGGVRYPKITPGRIDMGQFLLARNLIGENRWHEDADYADGLFIEKIYNENADKILLIDKPLSYFKKLEEFELLNTAPKTLTKGAIVVPDRDYYEKNIKNSLNPKLRTTIALLSRCCGRKFKVLNIMDNIINLLPLRKASIEYRHGNGILLIFENSEHLQNCFKPLEWSY